VARQARAIGAVAPRGRDVRVDPAGEAGDVARVVERGHQLEVQEQAAAVEVHRADHKETLVTTGLVFAFVALSAIFFTVVDSLIGLLVRSIFGFGS